MIRQPVVRGLDVGLAAYNGEVVKVAVFSGASILDPGSPTGSIEVVDRLLSPLSFKDVGSIRCIGLSVRALGAEVSFT